MSRKNSKSKKDTFIHRIISAVLSGEESGVTKAQVRMTQLGCPGRPLIL